MVSYLFRRTLIGLFTLVMITFLVYGLIRSMPGDPTTLMRAEADPSKKIDPQEWERQKKLYGLDKPWPIGYAQWVFNVVWHWDLGRSPIQKESVATLIGNALGPTLLLSIPSVVLAYLISVPIGLWSTVRSGRADERAVSVLLYGLYSLPTYVAALFLLMIFAVWLDGTALEMPLSGVTSANYDSLSPPRKAADVLWHMILPLTCFTYGSLAYYSRFVKSNMEEVIRQDYIRTARAKGVSRIGVITKHAFRNTLIPLVTMLGLTLPGLVSGAVILERVFTWPGMGQLFFMALLARDYPVIMGETLMFAVLTLIGQLLADFLYAVVDPRVTYS